MHTRIASVLIVLALAAPLNAQGLSAGDRQRLLAHLDMTESWLGSEIEGLTAEQLKFRMTPDSWTVMDVVEHLAIAEVQYWDQLQKSMQQPPAKEKPPATDAAILWYGVDRPSEQDRRSPGAARQVDRHPRVARRIQEAAGDDARVRHQDDRRSRDHACCSKATWTSINGS